MSPPAGPPLPYKVVYTERVRDELRRLVAHAKTRGHAPEVLEAARELDRRLHIYPQFGEPLYDIKSQKETVWIGVIPPLLGFYIIDEDRRTVFVVVPLKPLPRSGF